MKTTIFLSTLFLAFGFVLVFHGCKKEEEPPPELPTVATAAITEITPFTAKGGGEVTDDGGAVVTARGIVWGESENPSLENHYGKTTDGQGLGIFTSELTGLAAGTIYHVRAYATNSEGTSYGVNVTFTSGSEKASISTADITDITTSSAMSGGVIDDDGGAEVTERGIVWDQSQNPDIDEYLGKTSDGTGSGTFESLLVDLERGTTYYVRAYAVNSEGAAYGNELSFTTLVELATVTTAGVTEVTFESAVSGGNVTDDGGTEVTVRGLVWSRQTHPTIEENEGITEDGEGTGSFTGLLTGLEPETTYYVRAYATNSEGTAYGEQESFVTLPAIKPPTVLTNPISSITHSSAMAGGNVTESGGASVSERGVVYATTPEPTLDNHVVTARRGTGNFVALLTGLEPLTTYHVRAYATNAAGTAYGDEVVFTTERYAGEPCPGAATVTDRDGNVYRTVLIGNQCWFRENLKTTQYSDGTPIPYVAEDEAWGELTGDGYAWYHRNTEYAEVYGAIYNWHAVNTTLLCPPGWRVPSDDDWLELADYLITRHEGVTEENVGNKLKSCRQSGSPLGDDCDTSEHPFWQAHDVHYGSDDFGFSALPAGSRNGFLGYFYGIEIIAYFWSSTSRNQEEAYYRRIYHDDGGLHRMIYFKKNGYSVRCFRPK